VPKSPSELNSKNLQVRLTAIWALSESALGGVLHALRLPFTGLIVGGLAVVVIVLMSREGGDRKGLIASTIVVLVIKAIVSPHSPPTAYIAIGFQSSLGFLLFPYFKNSNFVMLIFSLIAVVESGLQKLIVLTVLFGENLWSSIDIMARLLARQFHINILAENDISLSRLIILFYLGIHLISGFVLAIWLRSFSGYVKNYMGSEVVILSPGIIKSANNMQKTTRKKKPRLSYLIYPVALVFVVLSYFFPELDNGVGGRALVMLVRSFVILTIWYKFLARYVQRAILSFIDRKKNKYQTDISDALAILPFLKSIVQAQWQKYRKDKQMSLKIFIEQTLLLLLLLPMQK